MVMPMIPFKVGDIIIWKEKIGMYAGLKYEVLKLSTDNSSFIEIKALNSRAHVVKGEVASNPFYWYELENRSKNIQTVNKYLGVK